MPLYYVTIFKLNGQYSPKYDLNKEAQFRTFKEAGDLKQKVVFLGEVQDVPKYKTLESFIKQSNSDKRFDAGKLRKALE